MERLQRTVQSSPTSNLAGLFTSTEKPHVSVHLTSILSPDMMMDMPMMSSPLGSQSMLMSTRSSALVLPTAKPCTRRVMATVASDLVVSLPSLLWYNCTLMRSALTATTSPPTYTVFHTQKTWRSASMKTFIWNPLSTTNWTRLRNTTNWTMPQKPIIFTAFLILYCRHIFLQNKLFDTLLLNILQWRLVFTWSTCILHMHVLIYIRAPEARTHLIASSYIKQLNPAFILELANEHYTHLRAETPVFFWSKCTLNCKCTLCSSYSKCTLCSSYSKCTLHYLRPCAYHRAHVPHLRDAPHVLILEHCSAWKETATWYIMCISRYDLMERDMALINSHRKPSTNNGCYDIWRA
jgi:hypothetical protein